MGKKYKRPDILAEIKSKINESLQYQQVDPDPIAKKHVDALSKDPCRAGKFFVNVTLKSPEIAETEKLSEREKRIKVKKYLCNVPEMKSIFEAGCIIEVFLIKDEFGEWFHCSASSYGDYASLIGALMPKYFDDSTMMMAFKPKKPVVGYNYIEEDIRTARQAGKKKIVYAMGRFNLLAVPDLVKEEYDTEKYDFYTFRLNNMVDVPYVDMTRASSMEQNVNEFINKGVLDATTMLGAKSNLPNYELKRAHAVYDMATYVNLKMAEIKNVDEAQANKKYKFYSEVRDEVFKDKNQARWDCYKSMGGGAWADWNAAQSQFLTFKSVSSYDLKFKQEALYNGTFRSNVLAYEKAVSLYNNSQFAAMDQSWKQETIFFKKKKPSGLTFADDYSGIAKGAATSFVMANMVDPPTVKVVPYGGSQIKFNDNIYYKFSIPANIGLTEEQWALSSVLAEHAKDHRYSVMGDPNTVYIKVDGYFKSSNFIDIPRETIKLEGMDYDYTGVDMKLDEVHNEPYENEMNHQDWIFLVPAESYYNQTERYFFPASALDDRFKHCQLIYEIMPKKVALPYTFIQDSSFETLALAEEREAKVRNDWQDKFLRCCVDTINYDPWELVIKKLKKLYTIWANLGAENEEYEVLPIELTDLSVANCQGCGKPLDKCECGDYKLCDKAYPLDLYGMVGKYGMGTMYNSFLGNRTIYGMFSAAGFMYDQTNHPLTYAEIAKAIYVAVFPLKYVELIDANYFSTITHYSLLVLCVTYSMIRYSTAFQMSGTIPSKLTSDDWTRFKKEYAAGLWAGKKMQEMKFSKIWRVGVADGYAYIPTGHDVSTEYNIFTHQFSVKGGTSSQTALIASLASCSESQYMSMYKTVAKLCAPLSEDMKMMIAYPFKPSVDSIINSVTDSITNPDEYDESYVYVPEPSDIASIGYYSFLGQVTVRFSMYIKRPVLCSYPKSKEPRCRTKDTCGFCGLRELFEKPLIVCPYSFDLDKEVLKRTARKKRIQMKKLAQDQKANAQEIKDAACNVEKNLTKIDDIKMNAISEVIDFANDNRDLFGMVGRDNTDSSNQESILCETMKIEKLKSIMLDYDQVFMHSAKSVEVVGDDNFDLSKEAITHMIEDFRTLNDSLKMSLIEIAESLSVYMMCNKKFNDYLTEQNLPKPFDINLIELAKKEFAEGFIEIIKNRLARNNIKENIDKLTWLKKTLREEFTDYIKGGNFDASKTIIEKYSKEFSSMTSSTAPNDKVMDVMRELGKLSDKKEKILAALKKIIVEILAPVDTQKSETDKFTTPPILMDGMKLCMDIISAAGNTVSGIGDGIIKGIKTTAEQTIYPMLGLPVPKGKKSASSGDSVTAAKQSAAKSAVGTICATVMGAISPYLTKKVFILASLGGVGGAVQKGDLTVNTIAGVNNAITGAVNRAIKKTELEEILKVVMEPVIDDMNNTVSAALRAEIAKTNASGKVAEEIGEVTAVVAKSANVEAAVKTCDNLTKNIGNKIADNLQDSLKGGLERQLEAIKNTVEARPVLNKIVDSMLRKDNGEMADVIINYVNGTCGLVQDKQDDEGVQESVENDSTSPDSLTQIYRFINDSRKLYQQITGEFIDFDDKG